MPEKYRDRLLAAAYHVQEPQHGHPDGSLAFLALVDHSVDSLVEEIDNLKAANTALSGGHAAGRTEYLDLRREADIAQQEVERLRVSVDILEAELKQAQQETEGYRAANESVAVCAEHTSEVTWREDHQCLVCELAQAQQEITRQAEQIDAMRGEDLAGLEHIEYCEECKRFFDSRVGCETDIRDDEREKAEALAAMLARALRQAMDLIEEYAQGYPSSADDWLSPLLADPRVRALLKVEQP